MTSAKRPPAACLIGWPAAHSRSPLIHRYWLRTLGIEGGYVIEAVPPDDLRDFVLRLSLRGFVGANVTIPHKEQVLALSTPDARAQAIGAIVMAMGMENAVFQIDGGAGLGLTYVTGALVKVGQHLAVALTGGPRLGWVTNLLLWAALAAGAVGGGAAYHWINLAAIWFAAVWALGLAALCALTDHK